MWIVVIPDIDAKPHEYWLGAQATMDSPQHWSIIEPASIGGPATKHVNAELYAVLVDHAWSDYLASSSGHGTLYAQSLPPTGAQVAGPITVTRDQELSGKSCRRSFGR